MKNRDLLFVTILLFCLNSFLTFTILTIYVMTADVSRFKLRLWGWTGVVFVSLLCMTKVPKNDLGWIVDHFHAAGQLSYTNYLLLLGKEPVYQTFSYAMHYLLADNEKLFIFVLNMISLSLLYVSLNIFADKVRINKEPYIFCVFLLLFFPFFFGLPVHIVRQTMAMSLFMFVFVNKICSVRFYWPLAILVPFIHSTGLFCLPFLFAGFLKRPINMKRPVFYVAIVVIIFSIQQISQFLLPYFSDNSSIFYALERASTDTVFESRVVVYQLVSIFLIGVGLFFITQSRKIEIKVHEELIYLSNFIIIIIIFIMSVYNQVQLQSRFSILIFQFLSFIACVYLKRIKIEKNLLYLGCGMLFFVWWYYSIYVTPFTYKGIKEFLVYTIFNYYFV